ncbi:hypothetical protein SKAU_G00387480 [Synaphobranchus kaupii]|uniref:Uncharacterized protein n=1 Tax=Synaphobranchus kaupii TaxID=118154 RepID=A0A9Q1EAX8_SYNKA|nr:hypothetical protein SKAU_G00387480 [Synaphobranchus kaupii]
MDGRLYIGPATTIMRTSSLIVADEMVEQAHQALHPLSRLCRVVDVEAPVQGAPTFVTVEGCMTLASMAGFHSHLFLSWGSVMIAAPKWLELHP